MTSTPPASHRVSRPEFIALIAALMALNSLAIDIMLPALPRMGEALGLANANDNQFVLTAYLIGFGVAQLFFGPISDRYGRRIPLFLGIAVYIVAAAAAAIAPTFETLLALRFVQGLGAAATRVIAQSAVRDRFEGRGMAEVMSLVFMVFMVIPIIAPTIGQLVLFTGHWQMIFLFMAFLAVVVGVWAYIRLDESLPVSRRRPLQFAIIVDGFRLVLTNRSAIFYGLSGMFVMGGLFGFINTSPQIYLTIYGLGEWFPVAFAFVAATMSLSSFLNSRIVRRLGMRRVAHGALTAFILFSGIFAILAWFGDLPFWAFMVVFTAIMFTFGHLGSNSQALSMEPLGEVAGTASSVFGFLQTVGGAAIGALIGHAFNGTLLPVALGFFALSITALICMLIAEKGKLFGVSSQYKA